MKPDAKTMKVIKYRSRGQSMPKGLDLDARFGIAERGGNLTSRNQSSINITKYIPRKRRYEQPVATMSSISKNTK